MGKLDRLEETVYFGDEEVVIREKPHKTTKKFLKLFTGLIYEGFKRKADDADTVGFIEVLATEKPYEALKIYVPELTEEQFDEATNREIIYAFKIAFKVNGVDIEKLTKNYLSPLLSKVQ